MAAAARPLVRFKKMDDDLLSRDYDGAPKRDNLFAWTVLILLLVGFAFASWIGSYYLFGHPENPKSYQILRKVKKIDPPKRFELTAAPAGKFHGPKELYDQYWAFSRLQFQSENEMLLRDYLRNFQETKKLVPYVVGRYTILQSYELTASDLFPSGVVAVAQSVDFPRVLIEQVFTAPAESVGQLKQMLSSGLDIKLERASDLSAIIHVEKLYDGKLLFTVVPLLYGSYTLNIGSGSFSLEPPNDLHLETGAPIVRAQKLETAFKAFASYRKKKGLPEKLAAPVSGVAAGAPTPSSPQLVRVEPAVTTPPPTPAPTPRIPLIAADSPTPKSGKVSPTPKGSALAKSSPGSNAKPTPALLARTTPELPPLFAAEKVVPIPTPNAADVTPVVPLATPAPGVKLEPFIAAAPAPGASSGSWRVYRPGQMPRGRLVEPGEATSLAENGVGGERIYLSGHFLVTASGATRGENRAVLRPSAGGKAAGTTRVIAEFPPGISPPMDGSNIARDELRPFQITDVRRGTDGQVNIYVREITATQ